MSFKHLSINTKLLLAFGWLTLASIFLTGWVSYLSTMQRKMTEGE